MKYDEQKIFPHPVLRPNINDYTNSEIQSKIEFTLNEANFVDIAITFDLSSQDIIKKIIEGYAQFAVTIKCRKTFFMQTKTFSKSNEKISIHSKNLKGEVIVSTYVVCKKSIFQYSPIDMNSEFGDKSFDLSPGDILAMDIPKVVFFDRENFKPFTSMIELVSMDTIDKNLFELEFDEEKIQILLNSATKEQIDSARNNSESQSILLNSLYFSTIAEAIRLIKDEHEKEDFIEKKWGRVLKAKIDSLGGTSQSPIILTQKLLDKPLGHLIRNNFEGED